MAEVQLTERTRAFLREVGIIVLGVLIALGFGEVADAVRHRVNAQRALAAVRADMIDNTSSFELWPLAERCGRRRLATVAAELDHARRTGRLRDIGEIGTSSTRSFRTGTWESAVGNGDTLFMDKAVVAELSDYHDGLRTYGEVRDEAAMDWARLSVLAHAPGPIDDNTLSSARQTLAELKARTARAYRLADLLLMHHRRMGVPIEYLPFNGQPRSREQTVQAIKGSILCRPLLIDGEVTKEGD